MVSSIGGFGFGLSQILFAIVVIQCARGGKKATAAVWDDARPVGLEWTIPSPAPYHSFTTPPTIHAGELHRA
jgi:cytochrome c oxidase subunit 1